MRLLFFIGIQLFQLLFASLYAQHLTCGSYEANELLKSHDPNYAKSIELQLKNWASYIKNHEQAPYLRTIGQNDTIYEVPIVFHVIHTGQQIGSPQNPSNNVIQNLVSYLNSVFGATWPSYPDATSGGVNIPIRFKLAQRTPDCNPSNGINRIDGSSVPNYATNGINNSNGTNGASEIAVKDLSRWPNSSYVNVWIVTNIQGAAADGSSIAGYAYYPGASASRDGIVLRYDQAEWSLVHEMGHYFGLRHTFEGSSDFTACPPNADCITQGDFVCDTDPHPIVLDCSTTANPCTSSSYFPVIYNIMGYAYCRNRFTLGQSERAVFQLLHYRPNLTNSLGGVALGDTPTNILSPIVACIPSKINVGGYTDMGPHKVSFSDISYNSGDYNMDGSFYVDNTLNTCLRRQHVAHVQTGNTYTLSVSLGSANIENAKAWIDWDGDGVFESSEEVLSFIGTSTNQIAISSVVVPTSGVAKCTPLRLRVFSDFHNSPIPTPCSNPTYGQVEDFTVVVEGAPITPSVNINANPSDTISIGTPVTVTASGELGSNPLYNFTINGISLQNGDDSTYISNSFVNNDTIACSVTSNITCNESATVTSNLVIIKVAYRYTFIGNGNWTDENNWNNSSIPPSTLLSGAEIIVNPANNGECILNTPQTISLGATLTVQAGKKLTVTGDLLIDNLINLRDGLITSYPFGGNANDASGNENNGTVNGATLTTDRFGNENSAYSFNGVDNYINIANPSILNFPATTDFSISFYYKAGATLTNTSGYNGIISRMDNSGNGWQVGRTQSSMEYEAGCSDYNLSTVAPDIWINYTFTFDRHSNVLTAYQNGSLISSVSCAGLSNSFINDADLKIGVDGSGTYFSSGSIDDVRIYNRLLTQNEINYLSNH